MPCISLDLNHSNPLAGQSQLGATVVGSAFVGSVNSSKKKMVSLILDLCDLGLLCADVEVQNGINLFGGFSSSGGFSGICRHKGCIPALSHLPETIAVTSLCSGGLRFIVLSLSLLVGFRPPGILQGAGPSSGVAPAGRFPGCTVDNLKITIRSLQDFRWLLNFCEVCPDPVQEPGACWP